MTGAIFVLLVAYIMGSFPIGFWVGQAFFKKDLTAAGSGNIGATNSYRILGPGAGILVFFGDFLKGAAPVMIMKSVRVSSALLPWLIVAAGLLAMLGHTFSVFLKFKGGKGASTAMGAITALSFKISIFLFVIWFVVLALTRYVSVSSMVTAVSFPALTIFFYSQNVAMITFSLLVMLLVLYKHRANIGRLMQGIEPKVGKVEN